MRPSARSLLLRGGLLSIAVLSAVATGSGRTVTVPSGSLVSVGPRAERGYHSVLPFDRIDMANGDLVLSFTDLVLAGDAGMDLRLTRSFSLQGTALPDRWGFSFVDVPILMKNPVDPSPSPWSPTLVMGDGSTRPLYSGVVSGYLVTTEFWRYHVSSRTLYLPNGWVATYEASGNPTGGIMLVEVHDPFGNQITPTWDTSTARPWKPTSVAQTVSGTTRTVSFQYQGNNPRLPSTMTYGSRTWTYAYATTSDQSLIRVEPPLGRHWYFTSNFSGSALTSLHVMVPTGGTVTYDFGAVTLQDSERRVTQVSTGGRDVTAGDWDFSYSLSNSTVTSQVTTPIGRTISFAHNHWSNAVGTTWTLNERTTTYQSATVDDIDLTYASVTLVSGLTMPALNVATAVRDGVTYTTDHDYSSSNFGDYLRPNQTTESVSSPSASRVITRIFDYNFTPYIINRVASETVAIGSNSFTTSSEYNNGTGFMESTTARGFTTTFSPDSRGNPETITDAGNHATTVTYSYGAAGTTVTPHLTVTRTINSDGSVASETVDGLTTSYAYDSFGRLATVTPPVGDPRTITYTETENDTKITETRDGVSVTTLVDGFGRPMQTDNTAGQKSLATYDAEGRRTFASYPYTGSSHSGGDTYTYDGLNRITRVTHSDSSHADVSYASGPNVTMTDENGNATVQKCQPYSLADRRLIGVTDAKNNDWAYSYNVFGSLTQVSQPGGLTRTWSYHSTSNLLQSETHPESGTTTFTYTSEGLLATTTDAENRTTSYTYDGNHRPTAVDRSGTTEDESYAYNAKGQMYSSTFGVAASTFTFEGPRLKTRTDVINTRQFLTSFEYNDRDQLMSIRYPSSRLVEREYNTAGQLARLYSGSQNFAQDITYHPNGAMSGYTMGNGTTAALTLDGRQRPLHLTSGPLDVTYGYQSNGLVSSVDDARSGGTYDATYSYDELNRLTSVSGFGQNTFTYDALGNRTAKASASVTYSYHSTTGRLSSASSSVSSEAGTFTYDNVGNMKTDGSGGTGCSGSTAFAYSGRNQMTCASVGGATATYGYNAEGSRVMKTTASGTKYYVHGLGGELLAEYPEVSGASPVIEYVYLGSKLLASFSAPLASVATEVTAPVASFTSPSDVAVSLAATATLIGTGTISSVQFYANGILIATDTSAPYTASWTPTVAGTYKITSRAIASTGKVASSLPVTGTIDAIGRVLSVSTSPVSPVAGQATTVTVNGNAYTCGAVHVDLGSGANISAQTYSHSGSLASSPLVISNVIWSSSGTKTITATGQGDCQGAVLHNVTVASSRGSISTTARPCSGPTRRRRTATRGPRPKAVTPSRPARSMSTISRRPTRARRSPCRMSPASA